MAGTFRKFPSLLGKFINCDLGIEITDSQKLQALSLYTWSQAKNSGQIKIISGSTGVGKSTLLLITSHLFNYHNIPSFITAPTNSAAFNLNGTSLHSVLKITTQNEIKKKKLKKNSNGILLVDNGSILSQPLFQVIADFALQAGIKVIIFYDPNQLPPIRAYPFFQDSILSPEIIENESIRHKEDYNFLLKCIVNKEISCLKHFNMRYNVSNRKMLINSIDMVVFCNNSKVESFNLTKHNYLMETKLQKEYRFRPSIKEQVDVKSIANKKLSTSSVFCNELIVAIGDKIEITKNFKSFKSGQRGRIVDIKDDSIVVDFFQNQSPQVIPRITIIFEENQKYFRQNGFALRLSWAMTVHKCMGLEFDMLYVDLSDAFIRGQTYTALSRVKSLESLKLLTPLTCENIIHY
ncbi:MAG: AAA family ATPase [Janthinobacterium lividum]